MASCAWLFPNRYVIHLPRVLKTSCQHSNPDQRGLSNMVLKIRLARFGQRRFPSYNIVVAQARSARNSKPIEVLGTYDPLAKVPLDSQGPKFKDIKLDSARAKYWLGVGAQPSDPVWRLFSMAGLMEPKYRPSTFK